MVDRRDFLKYFVLVVPALTGYGNAFAQARLLKEQQQRTNHGFVFLNDGF